MYFIALFALPAVFGARAAFYAEPISDIAGPGGEHRSLCPVHPADSGFPRGPARCGEQVHAAILIDKAAQPKAVPLCLYKIVGSDRDGELL